jgi:hypothetical protein
VYIQYICCVDNRYVSENEIGRQDMTEIDRYRKKHIKNVIDILKLHCFTYIYTYMVPETALPLTVEPVTGALIFD